MSDFNKAVKVVLKNEGKFNANPHDGLYAANHGMSLRFLVLSGATLKANNTADIKDILAVTPFEAKKIYKKEWWDKYRFGRIHSDIIAAKVLDLSVNAGCKETIKLVQKAVNKVGLTADNMDYIRVDGVIGNHTVNAINYLTNIGKEGLLLNQIKNNAIQFYNNIVELNPKLRIFRKGWLFRAQN